MQPTGRKDPGLRPRASSRWDEVGTKDCAGKAEGLQLMSTPVRLITQDELRAGAKRILARRRRSLVASWGGFAAAILATLMVPAGAWFFGVVWLSATMVTGLMVWDVECPRCHSPFHITLLRRDWRTCQCLHCGFDVRRPEEQRSGPTTIERRWL
jgi:hypothetical protein